MWLRLLVPFTLIWPVLALAAEGTRLRRYQATPLKELSSLLLCIVGFFGLWLGLHQLGQAVTGSDVAAIVAATILSLVCVPILLFLSYRLLGVKPRETGEAH
ncbi:MAG: hypothetical protein JSU87_13490 [Gemmatimonadota bacterium]|nr:MAG: hypothetical protein JSU87_13490 [Gemmatimonadota bacterium]